MNTKLLTHTLIIATLGGINIGCAQTSGLLGDVKTLIGVPGGETSTAKTGNFPAYSGPRHAIAVAGFKNDARSGGYGLSRSLQTSLEAALTQSNYFDVLDRTDWDPANGEFDLADAASLRRADYVVTGHITAVEETGRNRAKIPFLEKAGIGFQSRQTTIRMTAKVVQVKTRKVVAHRDIVGTSNAAGLDIKAMLWKRAGQFTKEEDTSVELASIDLVYKMTELVCDTLKAQPVKGAEAPVAYEVKRITKQDFVIAGGLNHGLNVGSEVGVLDEDGFLLSGFKARVVEVQADKAKCTIVQAEPDFTLAVGTKVKTF